MTFGGIQGFTIKPATPWFDDNGTFAGIVHQERNLTYVLFSGAGHLVPEWKPAAVRDFVSFAAILNQNIEWMCKQALVFIREFVLGSNETGLVLNSTVIGGENSTLADDVLTGGDLLYYGSATTAGTTTIPQATLAAWESFISTATLAAVPTNSAESIVHAGNTMIAIAALVTCMILFM